MKFIRLFFIFFLVCFSYDLSQAATKYIRSGANGSGTSWADAYGSFKTAGLNDSASQSVRGNIYYIADGSYGGVEFRNAENGSEYITIKKATIEDHGTDIGWENSYGDGQALFGNLTFSSAYWIFDGQTRSDWKAGYGFKATNNSINGKIVRINAGADYITLKYTEFENLRGTDADPADDGLYSPYVTTHINIQYTYWHEISRDILLMDNSDDVLVEYSQFTRNNSGVEGKHGQGLRFWGNKVDNGSDNITIRYNRIENIVGTGYIVLAWGNDNVKIYGNVFYRSSNDTRGGVGTGVIVDISEPGEIGLSNCRIFNNTFVNINGWNAGIRIKFAASATNYAYNNLWYTSGYKPSGTKTTVSMQDIINGFNYFSDIERDNGIYKESDQVGSINPLVDWENDDFSLAVPTDSGNDEIGDEFKTDPNGLVRGVDLCLDRGAFEYFKGTTPQISAPKKLKVISP